MSDVELLEIIKESGYYEYKELNSDDLNSMQKAVVVAVNELFILRPELERIDTDVIYIRKVVMENGHIAYDLPSKSLSNYLKEPPYEDSSIWTYSIKECKLLKELYKGTGTKWERVG